MHFMRMNLSIKKLTSLLVLLAIATPSLSSASSIRILNENSANKTYSVKVGATFHLVLHSTYWSLASIASSAPIKSLGNPKPTTSSPGPANPPGMGTGTLDWTLKAVRRGTYALTASRTSCGEALRCTGNQGSYLVRIRVVK